MAMPLVLRIIIAVLRANIPSRRATTGKGDLNEKDLVIFLDVHCTADQWWQAARNQATSSLEGSAGDGPKSP